jgi:hypothetical protein
VLQHRVAQPVTGQQRQEVRDGVGWLRWAKVTGAVRPTSVVVPNVFPEHDTQVLLVEISMRSVSSEGSDESFGEAEG